MPDTDAQNQQADPYAAYGGSAEADPYAAYGGQADAVGPSETPSLLDRAIAGGKNVLSNAAQAWGDVGDNFWENTKREAQQFAEHPLDTTYELGIKPLANIITAPGHVFNKGVDEIQHGRPGKGATDMVYSVIPFAGPTLSHAGDQFDRSDYTGGAGTLLGLGSQIAAGKLFPAPEGAPPSTSQLSLQQFKPVGPGILAGSMEEKPYGQEFTRREVKDAADQHGVNLDLADTTGGGAVEVAKKPIERSLGGSGVMKENTIANQHALDEWGHQMMDERAAGPGTSRQTIGNTIQGALQQDRDASIATNNATLQADADIARQAVGGQDMTREAMGNMTQQKLLEHQAKMNEEAGKIFTELDNRHGATRPDTSSIEELAGKIISDNTNYYAQHEALLPKRAWSIVTELSEGVADSWAQLHKLRSDLMAEYRSPDIVGTQAEGWLKQLVAKIDETMTESSSGLSNADQAQFRMANDIYTRMKETYDNPQHPFYSMVRAQGGTQPYATAMGLAPEFTNLLREAMGNQNFTSVQRAKLQQLIDPNGSGTPEWPGLSDRIAKLGEERLQAMFGQNADVVKQLGREADHLLKSTPYEQPGHPFRAAVNEPSASDVTPLLHTGDKAMTQALFDVLGVDAAAGGKAGLLQRDFLQRLFDPADTGEMRWDGLARRIAQHSADELEQVLGKEGARNVRLLGRVAELVTRNTNPSGTGGVNVGVADLAALGGAPLLAARGHPVAAAFTAATPLFERLAAKGLVSPQIVDYLTHPARTQEGAMSTKIAAPAKAAAVPAATGSLRRRRKEEEEAGR
jgi:hypothetical protein